jgi:radical SAM superfamily enzyme YgiQ (UPF0313 family)
MYNVILFTELPDMSFNSPIIIGAYKLAHVLRKNGYSCLVVNHFSRFTQAELMTLIDRIVGENTVLVGFSTTFLSSELFFFQGADVEDAVIEKIKTKNRNVKFVVGGTKSNPNYNHKHIDYACLGYSETSIVNLVDYLIKKTPLNNATKNIWGTIIIDDRFAPLYDFKNEDMVWLPEDVVNHKVLPIEIARGCIFKCKFCSYPMNGKQQLDFVKSEDNLRQELIDNYEKYGIKHYFLIDDTFNDHTLKLETMCKIVKSLNFQPIFWGYHRLDLICTRPETLPMLYDIGVRSMFFGIETLNPRTAKLIGKGYNIDKQIEMVKHIKREYPDISLHGNFMVGLPEESIESVKHTADLLLKKEFPLDSWWFQPLRMFKEMYRTYSSDIEKNYIEYGYEDESTPEDHAIKWKNKYMTEDQAIQLVKEIYDINYYNAQLIEGRVAMAMYDTGYKDYTFDQIRNIPQLKTEHKFEDYSKFLNMYKEKLFATLGVSGSDSVIPRQGPPTPNVTKLRS